MAAKLTLKELEMWRQYVWSRPYVPCADDWNETTKSYPARTDGVCRHKCAFLRQMLGTGEILYGRRTDQPNANLHAVLLVRVAGREFVCDEDGTWPSAAIPFRREMWPPPPPEPEIRTWPWPWYAHDR
jgi:hypothetical protein